METTDELNQELTEEDIEFILSVEEVIEGVKNGTIKGEYLEF